jgi:hypothetical protein
MNELFPVIKSVVDEVCECRRNQHLKWLNQSTGEIIKFDCKAYKCPACGPKKRRQLWSAIYKYLQNWDIIRFWTFTLTSQISKSQDKHYKILQTAWRYFMTYLRRSPALSARTKRLNYIRVNEMHKSGYTHLHVFIDVFLPYDVIFSLWTIACTKAISVFGIDYSNKLGHCNVKAIHNPRVCANYVVKYVLKASEEDFKPFLRFYSKSFGVIFFYKKNVAVDSENPPPKFVLLNLNKVSISSHLEIAQVCIFEARAVP